MATAATTRSRHRPHALRAHGLCALCWVGNGRDGMRVAARCSGPWLGGHRGASGAAPRGSPRRVGSRSTIAKLRFSVEWWYSSIGGSYYVIMAVPMVVAMCSLAHGRGEFLNLL